MDKRVKELYRALFGLPVEQVKTFDELTAEQVEEVRQEFESALRTADRFVYAVRRDGTLVPARERIRPEWK